MKNLFIMVFVFFIFFIISLPAQAIDRDGDGYPGTEDCDDLDKMVHPGATEICNGIDDDCDSFVDDDDPDLNTATTTTYYRDRDNDQYGSLRISIQKCNQPIGYVLISGDCNDRYDYVNPDAKEVCDTIDNDCDEEVDEDVTITYYLDSDGDSYGDPGKTKEACSLPSGYVMNNDDCNDRDANALPGGTEVCDELDNDCDGEVDEDVTIVFYADLDQDGFGSEVATKNACSLPVGYTNTTGDCKDDDASINPGAIEICGDDIDQDCDKLSDANDPDCSTEDLTEEEEEEEEETTTVQCPQGDSYSAICRLNADKTAVICGNIDDETDKFIIDAIDSLLDSFITLQGIDQSAFVAVGKLKSVVHIATDGTTAIVDTADLETVIASYDAIGGSDREFTLCSADNVMVKDLEPTPGTPPDEEPQDPTSDYDPCEGSSCGDRCYKCEYGDTDCIEAAMPLYCNAFSECRPAMPNCSDLPPEEDLPPDTQIKPDCPDNMIFTKKTKRCECIEQTDIVILTKEDGPICVDKESYLDKKITEVTKKNDQKTKSPDTDTDPEMDADANADATVNTDNDTDATDPTAQADNNEAYTDDLTNEIDLENGVIGGGGCSLNMVSQSSHSFGLMFLIISLFVGLIRSRKQN